MNISPFRSIDQPCDRTLQWAKKKLAKANLRAVRTFDLHAARIGLHDCSCPNHGTTECDCQMVVLLVYGEDMEPATLILHGNEGETWLSISANMHKQPAITLSAAIQKALDIKTLIPTSRMG